MKLLSRAQIEKIAKFRSENYLTTSFFLDTDKSRLTKKEITLTVKNLLSTSRIRYENMDISKNKKESLQEDLDKINDFCSRNFVSSNDSGLAIYSCQRNDFWQVFHLPDSPRNRIVFDHNPYVRPLSAILDGFHKICAFLIDRREALWYKILLGEISLVDSLKSDVPSKVREGGWEGYESKRIERHVAAHLHDHFKKAAQRAFALFKKDEFDWLFLGCKDDSYSVFEPLLHPYLHQRMKGRLKSGPNDSDDKVLKECLELERVLKKEKEAAIVTSLIAELEKGGMAVSGLKDTLTSLNRGEVQTLVVTRNYSKPGKICSGCSLLFTDDLRCPSCQKKTEVVLDIIDEAIEMAMDKNCVVKHITPPSKLDRFGKIGAFLRFRTE